MLKEIRQLQKRKIRLLGVCEAQREMFDRDFRLVQHRLAWLETSTAFLTRIKPSLFVAAPAAGFLLSLALRKKVRFAKFLGQAMDAWRFVDQVRSAYRDMGVAKRVIQQDWPE